MRFKLTVALFAMAVAALSGCSGVLGRRHTPTIDSRFLCDSVFVERTDWVTAALIRMQTIKAGMTRKDLLAVFTPGGGTGIPLQRTFVSRDSPYFKVDIDFENVDGRAANGIDARMESEQDRIAKISRVYLATPDSTPMRCDSACARHLPWVRESLQRIQAIMTGMTRKDLLVVFRAEGGIYSGLQSRFVSWDCQYFHVVVDFEAAIQPGVDRIGRVTMVASDHDRIRSISRPYLDWLIID